MKHRIYFLIALAVVAVLAAACSGSENTGSPQNGGDTDTTEPTVHATTSSDGDEATVGAAPLTSEEPSNSQPAATNNETPQQQAQRPGSSGPEFSEAPNMSGGSGYGADSIRAVRYGIHGSYERVVIDFGTGGAPAQSVPKWTLESPTGDGRLKVNLPSVTSTAVSDGSLSGSLLEQFYVVRSPDGGMFVDIFAGRAFYYRVIELSDPGRLAIDFKPSGYDLGIPLPARGGNTVVTEPRAGDSISSPMTVSGYSRNFEAQNTIILKNADGEVVARKSVQSNDWASTWGYFDTTLEFPGFNGEGTLMVGTESARDGSFEGVEIPVKGGQ